MEQRRKKLTKEYISDEKHKASKDDLKKQREYAFSSGGLAYRAHTYCVFNDPDFHVDIVKLRHKIESLYYLNVSLGTSYYDRHILPEDRLPIKEIADKYHITLQDLGYYADGYFQLGGTEFGRNVRIEGGFKLLQAGEVESLPVYVIGKYTTLEDIQRDWSYMKMTTAVQQFRNPEDAARKRSPERPTLIYAIFKARNDKLTYKKIYELYEHKRLYGYEGSSSQFSNEESLERYYRKYAPQIPSNEITLPQDLLDDLRQLY